MNSNRTVIKILIYFQLFITTLQWSIKAILHDCFDSMVTKQQLPVYNYIYIRNQVQSPLVHLWRSPPAPAEHKKRQVIQSGTTVFCHLLQQPSSSTSVGWLTQGYELKIYLYLICFYYLLSITSSFLLTYILITYNNTVFKQNHNNH